MKKLANNIVIFLLLSLLMSNNSWSQQKSTKNKPDINSVIIKSEVDTSQFTIKISGSSNSIKINGKLMTSTTDSIKTNNQISISGEGNTVSVIQSDEKSDVNIRQEGTNNQVIISQSK